MHYQIFVQMTASMEQEKRNLGLVDDDSVSIGY